MTVVELLHGGGPGLGVKLFEGFFVVAAELGGLFAFEFGERLLVPEHEVVGELADGMISLSVAPTGLFRGYALQRHVGGHKPFFLVVSSAQLLE